MIYVVTDENDKILGAVDTKRIIGFVYDGTSLDYQPRYVLKLDWGHTLTVSAVDMQHILSAMETESDSFKERDASKS